MAYLLQLYRGENSLKCRLCNKLLIDDIHITITEGRGCRVAEGTGKKKKKEVNAKKAVDLVGGVYFSKLFDLVQPWNILADVDLPTSRVQFFSQVRSASGRLFVFSAVKASERVRALLVAPAKNKSNKVTSFWREFTGFTSKLLLRSQIFWETQQLWSWEFV